MRVIDKSMTLVRLKDYEKSEKSTFADFLKVLRSLTPNTHEAERRQSRSHI